MRITDEVTLNVLVARNNENMATSFSFELDINNDARPSEIALAAEIIETSLQEIRETLREKLIKVREG